MPQKIAPKGAVVALLPNTFTLLVMTIITETVEATLALGRLLGSLAPRPPLGICIALDGPLGAGKTHLTRGIAEGAGVNDPTLVSSPTYVLLNIYPGKKPVYHLDAYRIASEEDFAAVGFEELLAEGGEGGPGGVIVVEWAQKIRHLLPADYVHIEIQPGDDTGNQRVFEITGTGPQSRLLVEHLSAGWAG